jgi:hypothetical protein
MCEKMRMMEKIFKLFHCQPKSVDHMDERSVGVVRDLSNVKARLDILSRLINNMQSEGGKANINGED